MARAVRGLALVTSHSLVTAALASSSWSRVP
jgi:hypothetical protein